MGIWVIYFFLSEFWQFLSFRYLTISSDNGIYWHHIMLCQYPLLMFVGPVVMSSLLFLILVICVFSVFFLVYHGQRFTSFLIFSKNQLLVLLLLFFNVFLFSISLIFLLIFITSFLLVALRLVFPSFSSFLKIYLFIYFWLRLVFIAACGLSLVAASGGYSLLQCVGFLLWWLLLLWSTGSRYAGFSSCGTWAQQLWLTGSRAQAQQLWHAGLVALWHVGSSRTKD